MLLLDLVLSFLEWAVESLGCRRANWFAFATCVAVGAVCLVHGSPGWAALGFGAAAVDVLTLKYGAFSDER